MPMATLAQKYNCNISFKHYYSATSSPAGIQTLARVHLMRRAEDVHRSCPEHFFREPGDVEDEADAADHKREKYLTKFFLKKREGQVLVDRIFRLIEKTKKFAPKSISSTC